jgi:serine/threonine-protein kinase
MTRIVSAHVRDLTHSARPTAAPAMKLEIGSWHPVREIGAGALARVFEARPANARPGQPAIYALKVLREELENDPPAVDTIRREAYVGRTLSHPHVIAVLDHHTDHPPYFVVMPYLYGWTLDQMIAARRLPVLPVALWIARQVAEGLDALSTRCKLMHGDIKPSNVHMSPDGHATLLDLGYACRVDEPRSIGERAVVGTLVYMAPEMLTSALASDIRSDIYSLGVVLYELIAGQLPFRAKGPREIAAIKRQAVPRRLDAIVPDLPASVAELVHAMLAREPLRRPQTPHELADRLTRLEIECFARRDAV